MNARLDELTGIPGIGTEIARSVRDFFDTKENVEVIERLLKQGVRISSPQKVVQPKTILYGKTICFTGTLTSMTRSEAKERAEALGAQVVDSVSRRLDFLVTGADPGSKLDKATTLGLKILSEGEFLEILKETL
jgi:DNA ligase (NAD+)